jgi:hypothetical protein
VDVPFAEEEPSEGRRHMDLGTLSAWVQHKVRCYLPGHGEDRTAEHCCLIDHEETPAYAAPFGVDQGS